MILSFMLWNRNFQSQKKNNERKFKSMVHQTQFKPPLSQQAPRILLQRRLPSYDIPSNNREIQAEAQPHFNPRETQTSNIDFESYLQIGVGEQDRKRGKSYTHQIQRIKKRKRNLSERRNNALAPGYDEFDDLDIISDDQPHLQFQNLPNNKLIRQQSSQI